MELVKRLNGVDGTILVWIPFSLFYLVISLALKPLDVEIGTDSQVESKPDTIDGMPHQRGGLRYRSER